MSFVILPGQLRLALCLSYAGMAAGLLYDLMFFLRRMKGVRQAVDMLFGLAAGSMYFSALMYCREDRLRVMGLFFFLTGYGLYRMGPGRLIRFCFHRISGRKNNTLRRNENG